MTFSDIVDFCIHINVCFFGERIIYFKKNTQKHFKSCSIQITVQMRKLQNTFFATYVNASKCLELSVKSPMANGGTTVRIVKRTLIKINNYYNVCSMQFSNRVSFGNDHSASIVYCKLKSLTGTMGERKELLREYGTPTISMLALQGTLIAVIIQSAVSYLRQGRLKSIPKRVSCNKLIQVNNDE